ncbi:PIG-L family deacetylase [Tianweitania sp. BSSL-BM11]|uniref:PIG-L family deacetylase n=1 Tax=Tianweitania aestuarii TaxID=2814886 RepID=A0ABS5S275_9HYPH|nr:PIG-L deacetylase family protein [Tianweitania aestuarii]MBS9722022.1 PIG-L family deacetylase [Tianweitania aestuarii]
MTVRTLTAADLLAKRVLVVAPHPDDETLGCGGLIWHLMKLDRALHVAFITDGGASHRKSPTWPRQRLAEAREHEAADALQRLGAGDAGRTFMQLHDAAMPKGNTPEGERALEHARRIVDTFEPDLVVLPWRRDPHCDHRDAWTLFQAALNASARRPDIWEYAIWLDELGADEDKPAAEEMERMAFEIGEALPAKLQAVQAHQTQLGALITDDPDGFHLTDVTIERLVGPVETYWLTRR